MEMKMDLEWMMGIAINEGPKSWQWAYMEGFISGISNKDIDSDRVKVLWANKTRKPTKIMIPSNTVATISPDTQCTLT